MAIRALNHTAVNLPPQEIDPNPPESCFEYLSEKFSDYVLSGRITTNWQECLMIAGAATAVMGIVFTLFAGTSLLCGCFTLLLGTSVTGIYCARKYATIVNLEHTVQDLQQTQVRFEGIADNLQQENNRLEATNHNLETRVQEFEAANRNFELNNQQLAETNQRLEVTNQNLEARAQEFEAANRNFALNNQQLAEANQHLDATNLNLAARAQEIETANHTLEANNQRLTETAQRLEEANHDLEVNKQQLEEDVDRLTAGVAELTAKVTQLTTSAERIRVEVIRFKEENDAIGNNVQRFDTSLELLTLQIDTSKGICEQIEEHFNLHKRELGEQMTDLRQLITELKTNNSTNEKLAQLRILNEQIGVSAEKLHRVENQYAEETGRLEGIRHGFAILHQDFVATSRDLRRNVAGVALEREAMQDQTERLQHIVNEQAERIQNLVNQFLHPPEEPFPPLPPLPRGIKL